MKSLLILLTLTFSLGLGVSAQVTPVSGDKDLRDTNVKNRSNELERIDREAKKEDEANKNKDKKKNKKKTVTVQESPAPVAPAPEPPKDALGEVYPQIKEDYESMQNSQAAIMNTYGDGKSVDYTKIESLSTEINKNAARLNANIFPAPNPAAATETKTETEKDAEKPIAGKSLRSLLVELDDAVAAVISSPIFQNLRTIEPAIAEKTKADLRYIVRLTEAVSAEAAKARK